MFHHYAGARRYAWQTREGKPAGMNDLSPFANNFPGVKQP